MKTCEINGKGEPCSGQIENLKEILSKVPSDETFEVRSDQFKAISEPTLLKILYLLQDRELCVCEIIMALEKPQSTISHHLNVLKNAGFIKGRKEGVWIHYKLINPEIVGLIEDLVK
ncbi:MULTISPECIES: ArsR/SmtB family transcription factor [Methanobacterium]|uniref:Metalloregulator ArsR/SmtB family transcription factor n=1 Tax=Methanobacterium veterum TaxID=408577 RepID=A0A9E4ZX05_9EURY|nr:MULTISPECIES: metalloregulator ArsR/SmtB family transcription factor [Methanobacterium]MCZ3365553.1 metalloregulator ArsR/SmtB family transcription factor [Methanobacterium veterum]MCZ3373306.1 metalloregulator ArsR/SmtB family transcription factor [Methanobacterium veterum]